MRLPPLAEDVTRHRNAVPAVLTFLTSLAALIWLSATVEDGGKLVSIDASIAMWLHAHALPSVTNTMIVVSVLGAPSTLSGATVMICLVLVARRSLGNLLPLATLVFGGDLLNYGLKFLVNRARPTFVDPLLTLPTESFPSGHAMASTVFYGFVIAYILTEGLERHRRKAAIAAGAVMIGFVCFSRIYLGVHYLSDVLAGIFEAVAWSMLVLTFLRRNWRSDTPATYPADRSGEI
jgi:membrane-associated phospholipid phosphatase